jgi:L-methionine (R)-S-oxide reductase
MILLMDKSILDSLTQEMRGTTNDFAKLLNACALIKEGLGEEAWVGFYLYQPTKKNLELGLFQGKPACESIPLGKGVVGSCFLIQKEIYVPDVTKFPGYISCDPDVRSEYVCPITKNGDVIGVFDVDSPKLDGLKEDCTTLKKAAQILSGILTA